MTLDFYRFNLTECDALIPVLAASSGKTSSQEGPSSSWRFDWKTQAGYLTDTQLQTHTCDLSADSNRSSVDDPPPPSRVEILAVWCCDLCWTERHPEFFVSAALLSKSTQDWINTIGLFSDWTAIHSVSETVRNAASIKNLPSNKRWSSQVCQNF